MWKGKKTNMLEFILLGFLKCGEMSGYQLKQCMAESTSNFFDASFGSIYPALKKLEKSGDITVRNVVEGGKFKKLYTITAEGSARFFKWLQGPVDFSKIKPDHLVKLFFYSFLPPKTARQNIGRFIDEVGGVLQGLEEQEESVRHKADRFQYATLQFGIEYYSFIIRWSKDLLKKMEGGWQ